MQMFGLVMLETVLSKSDPIASKAVSIMLGKVYHSTCFLPNRTVRDDSSLLKGCPFDFIVDLTCLVSFLMSAEYCGAISEP